MASSTLAQLCAGWTAVLPVAALAIYGWRRGGFLATIAGLQVLAAFLAAVALARPVCGFVESLGCPVAQSLAVAYALVFTAVIVVVRLAVGATVPEEACRLGPMVDRLAGILVGGAAGVALGGAILVGWSLADAPPWFDLATTRRPLDSGGTMLGTFARFAGAGAESRRLLLDGERPAPADVGTGVVRASEPFADTDGNGRWDAGPADAAAGEPYLDVDGDGGFTADLTWLDASGDGRRGLGLRECYRLADWRRARVMHAPRIESAATVDLPGEPAAGAVVYEARATDVDGDAVTFAIEPVPDAAAEAAAGVVIDPQTGAVTLAEPAATALSTSREFVLVVTDATGLVARQTVRLQPSGGGGGRSPAP